MPRQYRSFIVIIIIIIIIIKGTAIAVGHTHRRTITPFCTKLICLDLDGVILVVNGMKLKLSHTKTESCNCRLMTLSLLLSNCLISTGVNQIHCWHHCKSRTLQHIAAPGYHAVCFRCLYHDTAQKTEFTSNRHEVTPENVKFISAVEDFRKNRCSPSDCTGLHRECIGLHRTNILKLHQIVYIIADFTNNHVDAARCSGRICRSDAVDQLFYLMSDAVEEYLSDAVRCSPMQ